ncbi:MAG: hypothetical protein ACRBDX_03805 [Gammaproteobacteria bacterium]
MFTPFKLLIAATILFSPTLYAVSAEDYIAACTTNQNNRMDADLCECMALEGQELSDEEFEFFYAITAKDQEKVNKGHATLDANQKVNVMTLSMMGPSKCANKLAAQKKSSNTQESSDSAANARTTTEAVSGTADSASQ